MSADGRLDGTIIARRRFVQMAAATVAGALLAACGGSNAAPTATTAVKPTTAPPAAATGAATTTGATSGSPVAPASGAPTAAIATAAALPTPALLKNPPQGKPQGNKPSELVLVWGTNQLTTHALDPQTHGGTIAESQLRHMYETLIKVERDATTISPSLATSWKRLDDNTMQFSLRQGVKFHNGEEFDADAAQFSIMRPLDPKNNADLRTLYNVIDRVDVVDKFTINVHTAKPDPVLLSRLTGFSGAMVAPKWAAANGAGGVLKEAVGTGPYKFKSWSPNQDLVVESNEQYWGGAPPIKNVRMKTIAELATRVAALRSGEVHVAKDMPPEEVDGINKGGRQTARAVSGNRYTSYFMEVRKPPLDNVKLRQAINYAVDWDAIIQGVLLGNGNRIATVLDPWHVGYDPTLKPYPYDPDKAKSLMKEAGFANGFDVNIWFIQGRYMKDREVAEAIAQNLSKNGIRCKPNLLDATLFSQKNLAREMDGLIFASVGNFLLDADLTYSLYFTSEARDTINNGKGDNTHTYGTPAFDALVAEARYTLDPKKRNELYAKAQRMMFDEAPALFMYNLTDIYGVDNWVKWEPRFDEMVWAYEMKWNE